MPSGVKLAAPLVATALVAVGFLVGTAIPRQLLPPRTLYESDDVGTHSRPPTPIPVIMAPATITLTGAETPHKHATGLKIERVASGTAPQRFYTAAEFMAVAGTTPWPVHEWPTLWTMFSGCESPATTDDGIPRIDSLAVGDHGLAWGAGQIRIDAHPALARTFDLLNLRDNLVAAYIVWIEAGSSYAPWSCAEGN